ncbi:MAG: ATP-binding protein [Chlamydiia bacterium]
MFIPRAITERLQRLIAGFPAVLVTGPRQSGKSTLLTRLLPEAKRFVLDRPHDIIQIQQDPEGVLFGHPGRTLLLDEVQNLPFIFPYLKSYIDDHRQEYGRFVLTGSQHFALMKGVSESLVGRIGIAHLLPLSWAELSEAGLVGEAHDPWAVITATQRGFFPELWNHPSPPPTVEWWTSYMDTYLDRDIRLLHGVGDLGRFRMLLGFLAARSGQILNVTDLAKDAGIPVNTVRSWLHILEASFIIRLVLPWQENLPKRLVKAPKVFFYDTGLLCWLLGLHSPEALQSSSLWGHVFENLVVMEAIKRLSQESGSRQVYYFRSHDGLEVDLLIHDGTQIDAFEIKSAQSISAEDTQKLRALRKLMPLRRTAVLSLQPTPTRNAPIEILPWTEAGMPN